MPFPLHAFHQWDIRLRQEKAGESVRSPSPRSSRVERSAPSELDVGSQMEQSETRYSTILYLNI